MSGSSSLFAMSCMAAIGLPSRREPHGFYADNISTMRHPRDQMSDFLLRCDSYASGGIHAIVPFTAVLILT